MVNILTCGISLSVWVIPFSVVLKKFSMSFLYDVNVYGIDILIVSSLFGVFVNSIIMSVGMESMVM